MWYDIFLGQLESFADAFGGKQFFWGDIVNGTTMSILIFAMFTIAATVALIVNGTNCSEVKMGRTLKAIKAFTSRFGVIQKGNFSHFNKMCISKMPYSTKKSCIRFIFNPSTDNQTDFKRALSKSSCRCCTNAFIAYICVFGVGAVLAITTIALEMFYLEENSLFLAVALFYGAMLLIAMALQMYFIGNKYKNIDMQIYTEVVSRYLKSEVEDKNLQKVQNKAQNTAYDSIDELRRVVYSLIESGASKELLGLFRDGLLNIAATNYNSTADQLRIENIVSKINSFIA